MAEAEYYEQAVDWGVEQHLQSPDQLARFERTAALIAPGARSLLDVGTGNGAFLSFLESRQTSVELRGLERSKSAIAASQCHAEITEGSIDALPFDDRSFDTVAALEVIEHLPHAVYQKSLAEMARVARSQVLISVPYRERRQMVVCPECGCRFSPVFHLRTFDERALEGLVPGFRVDRLELVATEVHWLLTGVATRLRALRDRLKHVVPVPTTCPQCGFALQPSAPAAAMGAVVDGPSRSLRAAFLSRFPKARRVHWIIASYRRMT